MGGDERAMHVDARVGGVVGARSIAPRSDADDVAAALVDGRSARVADAGLGRGRADVEGSLVDGRDDRRTGAFSVGRSAALPGAVADDAKRVAAAHGRRAGVGGGIVGGGDGERRDLRVLGEDEDADVVDERAAFVTKRRSRRRLDDGDAAGALAVPERDLVGRVRDDAVRCGEDDPRRDHRARAERNAGARE